MKRQVALEFGIGVDLRGEDANAAACRAVGDALHRNGLTVADALGVPKAAMLIDARIGVPGAAGVDGEAVAALFPYGRVAVEAVEGGLRAPKPGGGATLIATAIVSVSLDLEEGA